MLYLEYNSFFNLYLLMFFFVYITNYINFIAFIEILFLLTLILYLMTYLLSLKQDNYFKLIDYECGFMSYSESKIIFDIQFFIVALLFIIFDLEIVFLLPWAISISTLGILGYFSMIFFIFLLIIGFIFEWKKGALNWAVK